MDKISKYLLTIVKLTSFYWFLFIWFLFMTISPLAIIKIFVIYLIN